VFPEKGRSARKATTSTVVGRLRRSQGKCRTPRREEQNSNHSQLSSCTGTVHLITYLVCRRCLARCSLRENGAAMSPLARSLSRMPKGSAVPIVRIVRTARRNFSGRVALRGALPARSWERLRLVNRERTDFASGLVISSASHWLVPIPQ
jgi:hypothetical protein